MKLEAEVQHAFDLVTAVRNTRNERGLSPKEAIELQVKGRAPIDDAAIALVIKLANVTAIDAVVGPADGSVTFLVGTTEYAVNLGGELDAGAEVKKAGEELIYLRGFLSSVDKKLSNERFVNGALPQVLENERKNKADAEAKIKALEFRISQLAN